MFEYLTLSVSPTGRLLLYDSDLDAEANSPLNQVYFALYLTPAQQTELEQAKLKSAEFQKKSTEFQKRVRLTIDYVDDLNVVSSGDLQQYVEEDVKTLLSTPSDKVGIELSRFEIINSTVIE